MISGLRIALAGGWDPLGAAVAAGLGIGYLIGLALIVIAVAPISFDDGPRRRGAMVVTIAGNPVTIGGLGIAARDAGALKTTLQKAGIALDRAGLAWAAVPAVYLDRLPADLKSVKPVKRRKQLFIAAVLPMILAVNQGLEDVRARLEAIDRKIKAGESLDKKERAWLARTAKSFDAEPSRIAKLRRRADIIPVPIAIAQAAIESGWGTSRFAREGNALFGQWTWKRTGLVPGLRPKGTNHRVRKFERLIDSVIAYMHNLNTHRAYAAFRGERKAMRAGDRPVASGPLVATLKSYSTRGDAYVAEVRRVIRQNRLNRLADTKLMVPVRRVARASDR